MPRYPLRGVLAVLAAVLLAPELRAQSAAERFDVVIINGRVLDGSGNPWFRADVGIRGDRVAAIGDLAGADATHVIDARGRIVAPGFIDIHSHADDNTTGGGRRTLRDDDARRRSAPNLVTQGITTVVVNQDGRSPWPIRDQRRTLERLGIGPNALLMIGHGEVRRRALGNDFRRPASAEEIGRMRDMVREGMRDGAFGISAGLEYAPGRWSTTDELVAIVEEIVPARGIYISHERSEGNDPMWYWPSQDQPGPPTLLDAVSETIEIGERTGAIVVASHIKAKGAGYWGSGRAAIQLIESARARGVQVYADQYPYDTSGSDGNTVLIPEWATAGGSNFAANLRNVLADTGRAAALRTDIAHEIRRRGGAEKVVIFDYPDSTFIGKTLSELAAARDVNAIEMAIALQLEGFHDRRGGARVRGFSLSEIDIEMYAAKPWVATATDGGIALPEDGPGTHARYYGTFPRKIRQYALDRGVITLEDAVRSSTALPAQILGLTDRGLLRPDVYADIVVFDPARIRDKSTFFEPHQYAEGIDWVLINGQPVVEDGRPNGALPGRVITNQQRSGTGVSQ